MNNVKVGMKRHIHQKVVILKRKVVTQANALERLSHWRLDNPSRSGLVYDWFTRTVLGKT